MGALRPKPGVRLDCTTVGGAAIVLALFRTAVSLPFDLVVTSASDGVHSGPDDPHYHGLAFDVRTHDLPDPVKESVFRLVMSDLAALTHAVGADATLEPVSGGLATACFFGFLEHPGQPDEHWHFQVRRGATFPPAPLVRA